MGRLVLLAWFCLGLGLAQAQTIHDPRYDDDIKAGIAQYLPDFPYWLLIKAQVWQESRYNCAAVSPVGARGCAQFMPATWREVVARLGQPGKSPHSRYAFRAMAYYMRTLRDFWEKRGLDDLERHAFAVASYNAGMGNIQKAWRRCRSEPTWTIVTGCLPAVTGRHAAETIGYNRNIFDRWWPTLKERVGCSLC